ncbi:MAG: FAD-binding oxidoreductase [Xanthobacteraceae bacterium]|nr:FAD-binding oxidoreductase [Xanthobacteraceae bacterium]QYK45594.1 MAG: FAD-binding oxidoreductase [Xanthobacteraceae bacterium]
MKSAKKKKKKPAPKTNGALLARFAKIVGEKNAIRDAAEIAPYVKEQRDLYRGKAAMVLRPGSVEEVAKILQLAGKTKTPVVPQGGNTGLVGGQISFDASAIVLSTQRLNKIREVDADANTMTVESGVILQNAQEAAAKHERLFPLSLGAEGSCTIGGNLSTNAGGTQVLAYGNARDLVLGLEVVLASGKILRGLRKLKKDNTGYDLRHLFMGAEGTLGIITAAVLKLFPAPRAISTAWIGVPSPEAALKLLNVALARCGSSLTSFELMPRIAIEFDLRHLPGARDPLSSPHPWYVLAEIFGDDETRTLETMETLLADGAQNGLITDAMIAANREQRAALWRMRTGITDVQKPEGGSIKHDISVPVSSVPAFMNEGTAAVEKMIPGARVVGFGHLGDGNIHFNISQPVGADKTKFLARWDDVNATVHAIVLRYGGSVSAEHGIGVLKRELLAETKDAVALSTMRAIKQALDPNGILNPGKVLRARRQP